MDVARILIEAGADINVEDDNGQSPLHWAIQKGNCTNSHFHAHLIFCFHPNQNPGATDFAKYLIEKGADVNSKDENGFTSLHRAVHKGNYQNFQTQSILSFSFIPFQFRQHVNCNTSH